MLIQQLSRNLGCIVNRANGDELAKLDPDGIVLLLEQHGIILFTGFTESLSDFETFTKRFGPTVWETHDVFAGGEPLGFHAEATWTPCSPDLVWFYCVTPAAEGGETKFCDGVQLLTEMDPAIRSLFLAKKLQFNKEWTREKWTTRLKVSKLDEALSFLSTFPGVSYRVGDEELLHLRYVTCAIRRTKLSGQDAFANTVLNGPYVPTYGLRFDDGSEIPMLVIEELTTLADSLAFTLKWKPTDFVLVDNSRVMHARNAYTDAARDIKSIHTNLRHA